MGREWGGDKEGRHTPGRDGWVCMPGNIGLPVWDKYVFVEFAVPNPAHYNDCVPRTLCSGEATNCWPRFICADRAATPTCCWCVCVLDLCAFCTHALISCHVIWTCACDVLIKSCMVLTSKCDCWMCGLSHSRLSFTLWMRGELLSDAT